MFYNASKTRRFVSWITSYTIIFIIAFATYFILFSAIKIDWQMEWKILFFGIFTITLIWINFLFFPLLFGGYTVGGFFWKIVIKDNPIKLKNIFILSWATSIMPPTTALTFVIFQNFKTNIAWISYFLYTLIAVFYVLSVFVGLSFFAKKDSLTINEKNSKLFLKHWSKIEKIKNSETIINSIDKHSVFDKEKEILKLLDKEVNE